MRFTVGSNHSLSKGINFFSERKSTPAKGEKTRATSHSAISFTRSYQLWSSPKIVMKLFNVSSRFWSRKSREPIITISV